ncbi:MAG: DUF4296 domain-containing protein [Bacteroidales bacterium]|nr:DUF4296 domain-containing protein [Bacteroidales bacterium]
MKSWKVILSILCVLLIISCGNKKRKIASNGLLTEEEMVAVLYDIHILDATVSTYNSLQKTDAKLLQECYDSIVFIQHECNDSIFKKSLEYYTLEGKIKNIYDEVVDSLNTRKALLENENR